MDEAADRKSRIIAETILTTIAALFVAAGLILAFLVTVSPQKAYSLYAESGNAVGAYRAAARLADRTDPKGGTAYERTVRLPALDRAVRSGLALFESGADAPNLLGYLEAMTASTEFNAYCDAVDRAQIAKTADRKLHVYLAGYDAYLIGKFETVLFERDLARACDYAAAGLHRWIETVGTTDAVVPDGGAIAFFECVRRTSGAEQSAVGLNSIRTARELLLTELAPEGEIAAAIAAVKGGDGTLSAAYAAKTARQLLDLTNAITEQRDEKTTAYWISEFTRLNGIYVRAAE